MQSSAGTPNPSLVQHFRKNTPYSLVTVFLTLWMLLSASMVRAQFYTIGTEPASVRWQHLTTPQADIIFAKGHDAEARYLAGTLQCIDTAVRKTLRQKPHALPIVLHSQSMTSNGFVVWTPKRMELYMTPDPNQQAQSWLNELAVHEYRHNAQISKLEYSLPKPLHWIFGQQPTGLLSAAVPYWYLEGDAVVTETALTKAGRGRAPEFAQLYRAHLLEGKRFSLEKAYMGSYKDAIPDYYVLGYHMVLWLRRNLGDDIFGRQLENLGRRPYLAGLAWNQTTGKHIRDWYETMNDTLTVLWRQQDDAVTPDQGDVLTPARRIWTSYRSPQPLPDGSVMALRSSMTQTTRLVQVSPDGGEKVLARPGLLPSSHISYSNGVAVWSETVPDIRREQRSTNRIRMYDTATGRTRTLRRGTAMFSPVLSPDGSRTAVVSMNDRYRPVLTLLDNRTGEVLHEAVHPTAVQLQSPAWTADGKLYVLTVFDYGKRIERYTPGSGAWEPVSKMTDDNLQYLRAAGGMLLYNTPATGINNIFLLNPEDGALSQVTSSRFGAAEGYINGDDVVFADLTTRGYRLLRTGGPLRAPAGFNGPVLYKDAVEAENFCMADVQPDTAADFRIRPYRKLTHLFHVHSWAPAYVEYGNIRSEVTSGAGVSATSQNMLGTMTAWAGVENDGSRQLMHAGLHYEGWFPVIEAQVDYGGQNKVYTSTMHQAVRQPDNKAWDISVRSFVPLDFSRNSMSTSLVPVVQMKYDDGYYYSAQETAFKRGNFEMTYSLKFSHRRRTAAAELAPKLGCSVVGQFTHSPADDDNFGRIAYVKGSVWLPGLASQHRIKLSAGAERQKVRRFIYNTCLGFPRGYDDDLLSLRLQAITADYLLPLANIDLSFGKPLYVKRIYADLFYDYADNITRKYTPTMLGTVTEEIGQTMRSYGVDLFFDCNVFRFYTPVTFGIRTACLPELKTWKNQLLFDISF